MKKPTFNKARSSYLIETLQTERPTRVVDIGANPLSPPPYQGLFDLGGCEVWGFEPQPSAYEKLIENARPNEHFLPYAIGSGEIGTLHICKASGFTSLLEPNLATLGALGVFQNAARVIKKVEMPTRRLDDLEDLPQFDLLKVDIQGNEISVFESGRTKLSRAIAVITEVAAIPLYINQPLLDDQMRSLRGIGFYLNKFLFLKEVLIRSESTSRLPPKVFRSQILDGDAVFLRGLLDLSELDDQQLRHQAILADAVYCSHDFSAHILQHLAAMGKIPETVPSRYQDLLLAGI